VRGLGGVNGRKRLEARRPSTLRAPQSVDRHRSEPTRRRARGAGATVKAVVKKWKRNSGAWRCGRSRLGGAARPNAASVYVSYRTMRPAPSARTANAMPECHAGRTNRPMPHHHFVCPLIIATANAMSRAFGFGFLRSSCSLPRVTQRRDSRETPTSHYSDRLRSAGTYRSTSLGAVSRLVGKASPFSHDNEPERQDHVLLRAPGGAE